MHHISASIGDVGERFAKETRRMYYKEAPERGIRGTTLREEAQGLVEEGIDMIPPLVLGVLKQPVH